MSRHAVTLAALLTVLSLDFEPQPARADWPEGLELAAPRVRSVANGTLVQVRQMHRGVPVVGRQYVVRYGQRGEEQWSRSSLDMQALPDDVTPTLSATDALGSQAREATLVIWTERGMTPRLAWRGVQPADIVRREMWQVTVDANTGALLSRRNLVLHAASHLARVYSEDPIATPTLTDVVLSELPLDATTLTGPDIIGMSCVDAHECFADGMGGFAHWCSFESRATTMDGNFLAIAPPSDPLDPNDLYAELSVYYHAQKAYAFFRTVLEDPEFALAGSPITAIANVRTTGSACDAAGPAPEGSELLPLDDAYFAPAGFSPQIPGGALVIGQGAMFDFAMEGDLIYHELGHALVATLAPEFIAFPSASVHGIDVTPSALGEGIPDYFVAALTNAPRLADYLGSIDPASARNVANTNSCPNDLAGEAHADGLILTGALWEVRTGLSPADRARMDHAVSVAVDAMDSNATFASFQSTLLAELQTSLGATMAESAASVFERRGLATCNGFVRDMASSDVHAMLAFFANDATVPAPVQFRVSLSEATESLNIRAMIYSFAPFTGGRLLIKQGPAPIAWSGGVPDASRSVDIAASGTSLTQTISGPFEAGEWVFQLIAPNGTIMRNLRIAATPAVEPSDAGAADAGTVDAAAPDSGTTNAPQESGCSCRAASRGQPNSEAALVLFALLALVVRKRVLRRR